MLLDAWPASISVAIETAGVIGVEDASGSVLALKPRGELEEFEPAVSMPTIWPLALYSGPPESPAWIGALLSIRPVRFSGFDPFSSLAVIDWLSAVTEPVAELGVPPTPPALPTAVTTSPTDTVAVVEIFAVCSPLA